MRTPCASRNRSPLLTRRFWSASRTPSPLVHHNPVFSARPADSESALAGVVGVLERGVLLRRRLLYLKENNMISTVNRRRLSLVALPVLLASAAVLLPWRVTAPAAAETLRQGQEGPVVTETIQVNHINVKTIPAIIKDTSGIERLSYDFKNNCVTVSGSQKAVDAFEAEIKQADAEAPV